MLLLLFRVMRSLHEISAFFGKQDLLDLLQPSLGQRQGFTLDWSPVHHKQPHSFLWALQNHKSTWCTLSECGRSQSSCTSTGRTCSLDTEKPLLGLKPGTFLLWGICAALNSTHFTSVQRVINPKRELVHATVNVCVVDF